MEQQKIPKLTIRCSQLGELMGGYERPKLELSETAKGLIEQIYIENRYKRTSLNFSKEMQKGLINEELAITMLSEFDKKLHIKNKQNLKNEYISGTLDLSTTDTVTDIKCSYDIFTYAGADFKPIYKWQLMGYMWLTGLLKARLAYVLTDTPKELIFDEVKKASYTTKVYADVDQSAYDKLEELIEHNHTYTDIPLNEKIKLFYLDFDPVKVEIIKEKYKVAEAYYTSLWK